MLHATETGMITVNLKEPDTNKIDNYPKTHQHHHPLHCLNIHAAHSIARHIQKLEEASTHKSVPTHASNVFVTRDLD